jgi:hypothetical protein
MNSFGVSMLVTLSVAFLGFVLWLSAFLFGFEIRVEGYFFGFGYGGLVSAITIFLAHAVLRGADTKEGEEL